MDTPSPDALCPPLEQTRSIVESRLGTLELEGTWRATYVLVHRERGDVVVLKLHDPEGRVRLERELVAKDGTCATLAQVIALMLERYFLRPDADINSPGPDGLAAQAPSSAPMRPQEPAPNTSAREKKDAPPPAKKVRAGFDYRLEAGFWLTSAWAAPEIGLGLRTNHDWEWGLAAGYDLDHHAQPISDGWGLSRRVPLVLKAKRSVLADPLRLDGGAELVGLIEHVHTEGLLENGSGTRFVPGFGLRVGMEFLQRAVTPFVELSASLLFPSLSRALEVDHRSVFELKPLVIGLSFGIRTGS